MAETETITVPVEGGLKREAEQVFRSLGLSTADAITLFLEEIRDRHRLPFEVRLPNADTAEALRNVRARHGLTAYDSVDALFADIERTAAGIR